MIRAVIFDLDGTLIDSAPDLLGALDHVLARHGLPAANHDALRHHASRGAGGILRAGLSGVEHVDVDAVKQEFLDYYGDNLWRRSRAFFGVDGLLRELADHGCRLGVVTNKISRFAGPVVRHAGWDGLFGCMVTGDCVTRPKPDPESVLTACRNLGVMPGDAVFVGDDRRDIGAGRAAGTATIVAAWGYLGPDDDVLEWGADLIVEKPADLVDALAGLERAAGVR